MQGTSLLSRISHVLTRERPRGVDEDLHPGIVLPDTGQSVYVIGDVHGCLRQLRELELRIAERAKQFPDREHVIVLVGDLIDRGPDSAAVIDHVMSPTAGNLRRLVLLGNHERALLDALEDPGAAAGWMEFGGRETLLSYGAGEIPRLNSRADFRQLRRMMEFLIPAEHIEWLRARPRSIRWGGYFIAHAGVRPGFDLEEQTLGDLVSIREPFLSSNADFGAVVVHGHTPTEQPARYANRIAVDTGCFMSGRLTAAMLEADCVRFLSVS